MKTIRTLTLLSAWGAALLASSLAAQTRYKTLYDLAGNDPLDLTVIDGNLLVTASFSNLSGWSCGVISGLQPTGGGGWVQTTLYTFAQDGSAGCYPNVPIAGPGRALYGTTQYGGAYDNGVLYELQPPAATGGAWTESVLYSFNSNVPDGTGYPGPLAPGPSDSFYCVVSGGAYGYGALVQLLPPAMPGGTWTETVLYDYRGFVSPGTLVPGLGGVFYGTNWAGPIIRMNPPAAAGGSWTEAILYTLTRSDGLSPNSLVLASDGTLYGTTFGTSDFYGTGRAVVFQLKPPASPGGSWTYTVLHDFGQNYNLNSPLILRNGNLYGTAASATGGQVFELQPPATVGDAWTLVHLHQFTGNQLPGGTFVMDKNGSIFGVTAARYFAPPSGTVYRLATK